MSPRLLSHFASPVALLTVLGARAQEPVPLIPIRDAAAEWRFSNGQEFPGATGALSVDAQAAREGRPSLKLTGDFTKGGVYVDMGRKIDNVDIRELTMWVRNPDEDRFTLRINDASGQTHQIGIKTEPGADWQRVVFPLERFFARRGEAGAVTNVTKYESWGGAKDGKWHGPATAVYFVVGKPEAKTARTFWLNDLAIQPRAVAGAEMRSVIALDEMADGRHDWSFSRGEEFKGAQGSLSVQPGEPPVLRLAGDFTGGGAYVAAIRNLKELAVKEVTAIRMRVRTETAGSISVQLVDGSGQTHQRKGVKLVADGRWHELVLKPEEIAGGEHWGGANDGKWHGPPAQFSFSVTDASDPAAKRPVLDFSEIRADAVLPALVQPAAFANDFEDGGAMASKWAFAGDVKLDDKTASKGKGSLAISRTLETIERPAAATSPAFPVAAGQWEINLASRADLHSPDSSYNAVVQLEALDSAGKVVERFTVADVFGRRAWQPIKQRVELPNGATSARFHAQLNKTYGSFWLDDVSAAYLAPAVPVDDRITRVLFSTAQLGNLLFPNDPRRVNIEVLTRKPLRDNQRTVSCIVRDYWGVEQTRPIEVALGAAEAKGGGFSYAAALDLGGAPLEIGRYFEIHAALPQPGGEPFRAYTSLAILPEAETKRFKPEEIPFTSRNWDNRIPEYIRLSDRLGVRICGLWGGWSSKPPYKAEVPGLELCKQLGMGWLTNTPCATIEAGKRDYDEAALRQGVRNLIEQFGGHRPMIINLGNEPHGTGERVRANVAAYRAVYEEAKKVDPTIPIIATSVEPNEEYFKLGYGQWCDAFDFHIYETAEDVRRTIGRYRELMKKYDCVKPIWSTELGLNSQGQTRHAVAVELIKKFATFFAAGGGNGSWFGLLYPDADGKNHGSSGDSHNVFDCRFNRYAPRLDAIAYYHAVNAIAAKKFVDEKQYAGGIRAFLFRDRDGRSLQVLWSDKGRADIALPLAGVGAVEVIRIDGSRRPLDAAAKVLTLTIGADPLLLLYEGGEKALPQTLLPPGASLATAPQPPQRGAPIRLGIALASQSLREIALEAPRFWNVQKSESTRDGKTSVDFTATPPEGSTAREADFIVKLGPGGELYWRAAIAED